MRFNRYVVYGKWIIGLLLLMPCYSSANCEDPKTETAPNTKMIGPKQRCFEEFSAGSPSSTIRSWKCCNTTATLSRDGTLRVKGVGAMENYQYRYYANGGEWHRREYFTITYAPWLDFYSLITNLIIEDGVTHIGDFAFTELYALKSVTIPTSVSSIGASAFKECKNLTFVTIPGNMTSIGWDAFERCENLTSVTFSGSVEYIGRGAFAYSGLTSVTFPNNKIFIDDEAFVHCTSLTSITLPKSTIQIGTGVFANCYNLTSVTIMNSKPPEISRDAFNYIKLNNVCLHIPATGFFAYRAAETWEDFGCVKPMGVARLTLLCILTALALSVAVFVVVGRLRKSFRKKSV